MFLSVKITYRILFVATTNVCGYWALKENQNAFMYTQIPYLSNKNSLILYSLCGLIQGCYPVGGQNTTAGRMVCPVCTVMRPAHLYTSGPGQYT